MTSGLGGPLGTFLGTRGATHPLRAGRLAWRGLYRQGRFPVGRLVRHYRFAEIKRAIDDMEAGQVIKPVLRMTDGEKDKA